ncbi:endonuclease III domain-containing protein [Aspergillus stella-maris]|uniref:endonuclease III domain-containing protein n=1 Tax=Aspergillus stella-maris TaxID=1810926 RepID=UPI003CCDF293
MLRHIHVMAPVLRQHAQRTNSKPQVKARTSSVQSPKPAPRASHKWNQFRRYASESPYPDFQSPSPEECSRANRILTKLHGARDPLSSNAMNADNVARPSSFPDVLHGLVYGVLCQATNEQNAIRQVHSLDKTFGSWTNFTSIAGGGESKLKDALACGGLHERKSRMIIRILEQVKKNHGEYTLNHLFRATDSEAMQELLSYYGIGPKTASCVLALTLQRHRFVVDTHIYRLTGQLGWRPSSASAELARAHLERRIPDDFKYSLHLLFITHGRECPRCRAGGDRNYDCELMRGLEG